MTNVYKKHVGAAFCFVLFFQSKSSLVSNRAGEERRKGKKGRGGGAKEPVRPFSLSLILPLQDLFAWPHPIHGPVHILLRLTQGNKKMIKSLLE